MILNVNGDNSGIASAIREWGLRAGESPHLALSELFPHTDWGHLTMELWKDPYNHGMAVEDRSVISGRGRTKEKEKINVPWVRSLWTLKSNARKSSPSVSQSLGTKRVTA